MNSIKKIGSTVKSFLAISNQAHRSQVTALTEFEVRELENILILLLMGSFTGIPSPPSILALELLPYLKHEIKILNSRARDSSDALCELTGLFGID